MGDVTVNEGEGERQELRVLETGFICDESPPLITLILKSNASQQNILDI